MAGWMGVGNGGKGKLGRPPYLPLCAVLSPGGDEWVCSHQIPTLCGCTGWHALAHQGASPPGRHSSSTGRDFTDILSIFKNEWFHLLLKLGGRFHCKDDTFIIQS